MIDSEELTIKKLQEIALKIPKLKGVHGMKKEELVKAIKEEKGLTEKISPEQKERVIKEKSELKKMIKDLKREKEMSLQNNDQKKVRYLRKKIKKLKRALRKAS